MTLTLISLPRMLGFLLLPLFALAAGHPRHQVFIKSGSKLTKSSHYRKSKSKTIIQHVAPNVTLSALGTVNIKG